ncbi:MAG: polysaccharide pyruvyl transferase family protein [Verrucomicrobiae bacterium]|nr:polysaccharide pyruvyl transferase family protein [Verrucomicrobiae bacterium]MDW8307864.1 polysaccharide pyruvyl transferase family protein [Verrucomicrobiales bacterium]
MRIGILTYHHVVNYGAVLQAYALSRFLRELGHHVETIDYRPKKALDAYHKALFENNPVEKENRARAARIEEFVTRHIPLSPERFTTRDGFARLAGRYEAVVTGSDEVWNINSFRGFDPSYFLDFADGARRIAYAASFGYTTTTGKHRDEIARLVRAFDALSVRDSQTQRILQQECGCSSLKVLDPTLLFASYDEVAVRPKETGFILVYSNPPRKQADFIRRFAEREGKPIIAMAYPMDGAINRLTLSPQEWIGHFAAADYVFNGFFHGVAFSLIFRKPFTAFSSPDKIVKVSDLLTDMGLQNRIISDPGPATPLPESNLDYRPVEPLLAAAVDVSRGFLKSALDETFAGQTCVHPPVRHASLVQQSPAGPGLAQKH